MKINKDALQIARQIRGEWKHRSQITSRLGRVRFYDLMARLMEKGMVSQHVTPEFIDGHLVYQHLYRWRQR